MDTTTTRPRLSDTIATAMGRWHAANRADWHTTTTGAFHAEGRDAATDVATRLAAPIPHPNVADWPFAPGPATRAELSHCAMRHHGTMRRAGTVAAGGTVPRAMRCDGAALAALAAVCGGTADDATVAPTAAMATVLATARHAGGRVADHTAAQHRADYVADAARCASLAITLANGATDDTPVTTTAPGAITSGRTITRAGWDRQNPYGPAAPTAPGWWWSAPVD